VHSLLNEIINGPARYSVRHHFSPLWTLAFVLGILLAEFVTIYLVGYLIVKAVQNIRSFTSWILRLFGIGKTDNPRTFLELTIPTDTTKSAFATEQLHILLRSLVTYNKTWERLAAHKKPYSLELYGTHNDGIRFILMIPTFAEDIVRRNLLSFLPGLKIKPVDDYLSAIKNASVGVIELKLGSDFVLPLQDHKILDEHDPMAYLTGHMTKLLPKELVASQLVVTPLFNTTHHRVLRHIRDIEGRIALNKELSSKLAKQRTPHGYIWWLVWYPPVWFLGAMLKVVTGAAQILGSALSRDHDLPEFMKTDRGQRKSSNPYELELGEIIKSKLDQQLFEVTMRILVASPDPTTITNRLEAIAESFKPFTSTYQSIRVRSDMPFITTATQHFASFKARVLSPHHLSQPTILSSSELSDLYHFPNTDLTKTEGLVKSRSRELPAPLSISHSDTKLDVVVGVNEHGGEQQLIGMTLEQRRMHTYVIGKTGTGKTTLLTNSIYQDMVSGKGLAVLDPHGDMFQELLSIVPENRRKDVIVFDPSDRNFPIGLNILDPGLEFADDEDREQWITSNVLSVFAKLADEKLWGPRMEHVLRSTTLTALQTPNPSLYTIQRLLTDRPYQRAVAKTLKDPVLKQFWQKEFTLMGGMQLSNVTQPLTNRLGHFITTKMSRHILMQEKSTLRIADIMNEGKILLVNLSKGDIGEDQSSFFGTILTSFIWMAAYQRTKIPERERRDFFLYVDEFQNFATPRFAEITSEGRKFRVSLIVSHQNIAQIEDKSILKVVAGNAHTIISLKASPDDEAFILPFMKPVVERGDIVNLAPYHFFMKTTADESEDAFSGMTEPLEVEGSDTVRDEVIAYSQEQYGTPKKTVEAYMEELFTTDKQPKKPKAAATTTKKSGSLKTKDTAKVHGA
jgi:nucleoside-triphosphatase THEP1